MSAPRPDSGTSAPRPYGLLAELTHRCPLHCPYCSNSLELAARAEEMPVEDWERVLRQAAQLGVVQVGFSGGEPLLYRGLAQLVEVARAEGLYSNLITSGVGLGPERAQELRRAGLDAVQISIQADDCELGDDIAGVPVHERKLIAARDVVEAGFPLGMNVVLHRRNIDRLPAIIALAESLGAMRLELANTQFYGWAFQNRAALLPTHEQVLRAEQTANAEAERLAGKMQIIYVLPDYYEKRPKPCLRGWGAHSLTVNPRGDVLPCQAANSIPDLVFENVRDHSLERIWQEGDAFNRFRGFEWMAEPCRSCDFRELDFGGCRCQAALLAGDAARTDPVCEFSPDRPKVDALLAGSGIRARRGFTAVESNWMTRRAVSFVSNSFGIAADICYEPKRAAIHPISGVRRAPRRPVDRRRAISRGDWFVRRGIHPRRGSRGAPAIRRLERAAR